MKKYIILLIFIAIITHLEFFNFWNILFFSDWTHWSNSAVQDLLNFWYGWWITYFNFWWDNIQYYFNFFKLIWWVIWDYETATKITFFIPVALLWFLSPFFLVKHYTKHNYVAFLVSLFFWLNTYFLVRQTAHIPIAIVIGIMPLLLLFFDKFIQNNNKKDLLLFSFLYFIWICYEVRLMYIITFLLIIYFLFFGIKNISSKFFWKYVLLFIIIQLLLNIFWLLPTILFSGESISWTANRWLFWNHLFNILYAFNIFDSSWSWWVPNQDFIPQPIPIYLWFYPILIVVSILFIKKQTANSKKLMLFWLTISIIWIILTTQSSDPLPWLYQWLYYNFPWFNLFREASKFYIITLLWYTIILGVFINYLYKINKNIFHIIWVIIILISASIAKPLITKEIWTTYVWKIQPIEYKILNDYIISQDESFKTLSIPINSQWLHFNVKNPKVSLIQVIDSAYKDFTITPPIYRNYGDVASFIFEPISNKLLDISWIKYVIIWLFDEQDNFFRFYGSSPEEYYNKLKSFTFLKELNIDWIDKVKIFENTWYLSTVFSSNKNITQDNLNNLEYKNIKFIQQNPSYYNFKLNLNSDKIINLSQENNKNWSLIIWKFKPIDIITWDLFSIANKNTSLDFINAWTLSKDEIISYVNKNYSKELEKQWYPKQLLNGKIDYKYYILNSDGSIDIDVTLYFKPQSYFYLGLIISGTTFIVLTLYLTISVIRNRKNRENQDI